MSAERHEQIAELFRQANDLTGEERTRFLDGVGQTDPTLRAEVESLLASDGRTLDALDQPTQIDWARAIQHAHIDSLIGKTIGQFRIIDVIASGGMGVVYRAEQDQPQRTVALKVMRQGLRSVHSRRRFEYESQILGRLQHPAIAQVHDAGVYETDGDRTPYFAMELIPDARTLTEFIEQESMDQRSRIELCIQVCDAVHHGHIKGVVHRDLKPENILVDGAGHPKVIDFGVARLTDSDIAATMQTDVGQLIGTLAYMSPEQVQGDPGNVDARSDVYALGVVLFEMLSGELPYDVSRSSIYEATRTIREQPARRLGTVDRRLRGDIETIVLKAMEKDAARRYQSAASLGADLERYLKMEPILARPPSVAYQLRMAARRHKALVGGGATTFLALIAGVIVSVILLGRARSAEITAIEEAAATNAVNEFFNEHILSAINPDRQRNRNLTIRDALVTASERIAGTFDEMPLVEGTVSFSIGRAFASLSEFDRAEPLLLAAYDIFKREKGEEYHQTQNCMNELAILYGHRGDFERSLSWHERCVAVEKRIHGEGHVETLTNLNNLGNVCAILGELERAEEILTEALAISEQELGDRSYETVMLRINLGDIYRRTGRLEESESMITRALDNAGAVWGKYHPTLAAGLNGLARTYHDQRRYDEAERAFHRCLEVCSRVYGPEHFKTLITQKHLGNLLIELGHNEEAQHLLGGTRETMLRLLEDNHPETMDVIEALARLDESWDGAPTPHFTDRSAGAPLDGFALDFDGIDDHVVAPPLRSLRIVGEMTIECWIRPDFVFAEQVIIEHGAKGESESTNVLYLIRLMPGGELHVLHESANGSNTVVKWTIDLREKEWRHLALVRTSKPSPTYLLYLDGTKVGEHEFTDFPTGGEAGQLRLGGRVSSTGGQHFNGLLAEVRLWNIARTAAQIRSAMHQRFTRGEAGLCGYWPFAEGAGDTTAEHISAAPCRREGPAWLPISSAMTEAGDP